MGGNITETRPLIKRMMPLKFLVTRTS